MRNADRSIPLPTFQSTGSAGADVHANFGTNQTAVTILPGDRLLIPTGFSLKYQETMRFKLDHVQDWLLSMA